MCLSNERIVVSDPYQEGYPPYGRAVDGAPRVGRWFGGRHGTFEANLAALGVRSTFRPFGPWGGAYVDFALPARRLRELDPRTLRVTAAPNSQAAAHVLDRNALSVWSTGRPKQGGEWIQVDLGLVEPVALVRWLPRVFQEVPSGLRLEASVDGVACELQSYGPFYWSAGRPSSPSHEIHGEGRRQARDATGRASGPGRRRRGGAASAPRPGRIHGWAAMRSRRTPERAGGSPKNKVAARGRS
jgi:hypothetical protein